MMKYKRILMLLLLALMLGGCGGDENVQDEGAGAGVETSGVGGQAGAEGEALGPGGKPTTLRIHFEFDSDEITEDSRVTLEAHAGYLASNADVKVKLEGHADERGTREYNLALGERRAKSAAKLLQVLGVASSRIETTSYGEEKPLDEGHDEDAWATNRRVEVIYEE